MYIKFFYNINHVEFWSYFIEIKTCTFYPNLITLQVIAVFFIVNGFFVSTGFFVLYNPTLVGSCSPERFIAEKNITKYGVKKMGVYESTLKEIKTAYGEIPGFMKFFPRESLVRDWSSWKKLDEMELERARYLLNTDEITYEMLGEPLITDKKIEAKPFYRAEFYDPDKVQSIAVEDEIFLSKEYQTLIEITRPDRELTGNFQPPSLRRPKDNDIE